MQKVALEVLGLVQVQVVLGQVVRGLEAVLLEEGHVGHHRDVHHIHLHPILAIHSHIHPMEHDSCANTVGQRRL